MDNEPGGLAQYTMLQNISFRPFPVSVCSGVPKALITSSAEVTPGLIIESVPGTSRFAGDWHPRTLNRRTTTAGTKNHRHGSALNHDEVICIEPSEIGSIVDPYRLMSSSTKNSRRNEERP